MTEEIQQSVPYSVQAAGIVRSRILSGEYELGQRLSEVELSTSLGISRSPLREALRVLANEGLVTVHNGRGVFVADFNAPDVSDLLELREALDVHAVRLAAQRASEPQLEQLQEHLSGTTTALRSGGAHVLEWPTDFHLAIYETAGSRRLREQGRAIHTQLRLVRFRSGAAADRMEQAHSEHVSLLEAIRTHDADLAAERMREHLAHSAQHIQSQLSSSD